MTRLNFRWRKCVGCGRKLPPYVAQMWVGSPGDMLVPGPFECKNCRKNDPDYLHASVQEWYANYRNEEW